MISHLKIENACCEGCKKSIETYTKELPGLNSLTYDLETKTATVEHGENLPIQAVVEKIGSIGKGKYKAEVIP